MKKDKKTAAPKPGLSWYKRMDFSKKTALWGMIFLLPWLIGLIFFFLRPLINTVWYSLCSMQMENGKFVGTFNGIENFKWVLGVNAHYNRMITKA